MADVVVLWYGPDRAVVRPLIARLRDAGIGLWCDEDGLDAGAGLVDAVREQIHVARVAIVCVSDAAANLSEWFQTEAAWCNSDLHSKHYPLARVATVAVGKVDRTKLPPTLKGLNAPDLGPGPGQERELARLVRNVHETLHGGAPLVVNACVAAMTRAECRDMLAEGKLPAEVRAVCERSGVAAGDVDDHLLARHGDTPAEFRPFAGAPTCVDLVQQAIRRVNADCRDKRVTVWLHDEFLDPSKDVRDAAASSWRKADSLLVVDAVSVQHPRVVQLLREIPTPREPSRGIVLWVPPHSAQVGALDPELCAAARLAEVNWIRLLRNDWANGDHLQSRHHVTFDACGRAGLASWLYQALTDVGPRRRADPATLERLRGGRSDDPTRYFTVRGQEGAL
jgi:hypothetical protein